MSDSTLCGGIPNQHMAVFVQTHGAGRYHFTGAVGQKFSA